MLGVTTELFCPQFPHQPGHQTRWFLSKTETDTDWHLKYSQYWTQLALGAGIYSAEDIQTPGPKGQEIKQTVKEDFSRFTAWELKTNLCEIKSLIIIEKGLYGTFSFSVIVKLQSSQRFVSSTILHILYTKWIHQLCWNFFRVEIYYQTLNIQTITQSAQYNVSTPVH